MIMNLNFIYDSSKIIHFHNFIRSCYVTKNCLIHLSGFIINIFYLIKDNQQYGSFKRCKEGDRIFIFDSYHKLFFKFYQFQEMYTTVKKYFPAIIIIWLIVSPLGLPVALHGCVYKGSTITLKMIYWHISGSAAVAARDTFTSTTNWVKNWTQIIHLLYLLYMIKIFI